MTTTLATIENRAEELNKEISPALFVAKELIVRDAETYTMAGNVWKDLTALEKRVSEYWADDVSSALKLHKSLVAKRDGMLRPIAEQKASLRFGMRQFEDDQERIRRVAQEKAESEARKVAEESMLSYAAELEKNGHKEEADAVIESPVVAQPVFITKTIPSGFGSATRRTWGAEVTDMMALVQAVAAGVVPIKALEANTVFLNGQARMLKSALAYPGVKAVEK